MYRKLQLTYRNSRKLHLLSQNTALFTEIKPTIHTAILDNTEGQLKTTQLTTCYQNSNVDNILYSSLNGMFKTFHHDHNMRHIYSESMH